jgi:hypothetical protein
MFIEPVPQRTFSLQRSEIFGSQFITLRSLETARKSLIFRGSPSFFMANVRRRDGPQNSYGAREVIPSTKL